MLSALALVVGLVLGVLGERSVMHAPLLGSTTFEAQHFAGDVFNGLKDTKMMSAGVLVGPVNTGANTLQIGTNGTSLSQLLKGNCALIGMDASQAATTTEPYDCAVANVKSGDVVLAQLELSASLGTQPGWVITGAKASTTPGYITVLVENITGAAAVPSVTGVGSSTAFVALR